MNRYFDRAWRTALILSVLTLIVLAQSGAVRAAMERHSLKLSDGTKVRYRVVTPKGFDPTREYPTVLYFAGGAGDMRTVAGSIRGSWGKGAEESGYLLIAPIVNGRKLFFRGGEAIFPEFLDRMRQDYKITGGKFHLFGISNGGISAMHVAALHPGYFTSVLTMPGYLKDATPERYGALKDMCIALIAGETDTVWAANATRDHAALTDMGRAPFIRIVPGGGHVPSSYRGDNAGKIFDLIESGAGC